MKRSVVCYKIQFAEKASEISVCGSDALANFIEPKYREFYGKGYVDMKSTENIDIVTIDIDLEDDWLDYLDFTEQKIKAALEKKTGFKVKSFSFCVK